MYGRFEKEEIIVEWTEGRRNSFIKGVLRKGFTRYPAKYDVINQAYIGKMINKSSGRTAKHYECNMCKNHFPLKDVVVDHINPVVPLSGFTTWDEVIENLFCGEDNLQVLCLPCHKVKTKEENTIRKSYKK